MPRLRSGRRRLVERIHQPIGMGGLQSRPRKPAAYLVPRGLGSLGDDATDAPLTDPVQIGNAQLAAQQQMVALMNDWNVQDKKLRLIQIATTAAIPLFAAAWRLILGWRRGESIL